MCAPFLSLVDIEFIWWKRELFMRKFEMKCVCVYLYIINDSWKSRVSHTNSNVPFYFVSFQFIQDDSCIRILQKITQTRKFKTKIIKKWTNTFMLKLWHDSHFFSLSPIFSVFSPQRSMIRYSKLYETIVPKTISSSIIVNQLNSNQFEISFSS